jgi:hypothetical protein
VPVKIVVLNNEFRNGASVATAVFYDKRFASTEMTNRLYQITEGYSKSKTGYRSPGSYRRCRRNDEK